MGCSPQHASMTVICRTKWSRTMRGTLLDGFFGQTHKHCGFLVTDPVNFAHWNPVLFAGKRMACFYDQLANHPVLVVQHKIADVAAHPDARLHMVAVHSLRTP